MKPDGASDAGELAWRQLGDAEFSARALPIVEAWLSSARVEPRDLLALDDELVGRLLAQRATRRRAGGAGTGADLRPLCYLLLMAMEKACSEHAAGVAPLLARGLRLAGLHALGCMIEAEPIAAPTWSLAHRLYQRAEAAGEAASEAELGFSAQSMYVHMLLLSTLSGNGMSARQIDRSFDWLQAWSREIVLDVERDPTRHYFAVDLDGGAGFQGPESHASMHAPRFFDHARLVERVAVARAEYFREISVSTLGLYDSNPLFEYHDALFQLNRYWEYVCIRHSGRDTGRQRIEEVQVVAVAGFDPCVRAVNGEAASRWTLVDMSPTGAGFQVAGFTGNLEKGALTVYADPRSGQWVLGTAARVAASAQGVSVGVRKLADDWRAVRLREEPAAPTGPGGKAPADGGDFGFFIFGDEARGLADSIILKNGTFDPTRIYTMRPGQDRFRIRLSRVIQSAGDWERVGFDVLKRLAKEV